MSAGLNQTTPALSAGLKKPGRALVSGAAGFIGFHLSQRLLSQGWQVQGVDNLNAYYEPTLKAARLKLLRAQAGFQFHQTDIADRAAMAALFQQQPFDLVLHLAAQAGVRHSVENPMAYLDSNLAGMLNVLEGVRHAGVGHLVYASSSSIYGAATELPLRENQMTDQPISLYAATKKANELMAHSYSHLYQIPASALRFFTVYGPWGRPDMAIFKFVRAVLNGQPIDVYNNGQMRRDFTYIDDVVNAVLAVAEQPPHLDSRAVPHRVLNVGNSSPVTLQAFIASIEQATGLPAVQNLMPMQPGDVYETWADTHALESGFGVKPSTDIALGVQRFVDWYRSYYGE